MDVSATGFPKRPLHISPKTPLSEAWEIVMSHLDEAMISADHPFRFVTLATIDKTGKPQQRMVVLRGVHHRKEFVIFTDKRSDKVDHITHNPAVSLLFYDIPNRLQLRVTGHASVITHGDEHARSWNKRGSKNPFSYTSVIPPGSVIDHPKEAYNWSEEDSSNFCLVKIEATYMEFLQLDGLNHIRAEKTIKGDSETLNWLAP